MMNNLPYSENAEMAAIAIALSNPSVLSQDPLFSESFYDRRHQIIWETILCMFVSGQKIDYITVAKNLQNAGDLEKVGGIDQFRKLNIHEQTTANFGDYCDIIRDAHRCRREIEILRAGMQKAYDGESGAVEVIGKLATLGIGRREEKSLHELGNDFLAECKAGTFGKFGWWSDEWTQKLGKLTSDLVILHAPRSTGKTALMLQWILKSHKGLQRTPLASIEMLRKELVPRLISNLGSVSTHKMRVRGCVTDQEETAAKSAIEKIRTLNLCVRDKSMSIDDICTWAISEKSNGVDALFIDNLLSISDGGKQYQSKTIMYDHFIRRLRDLRDQLGVPVILLAHPNAEGAVAWSKDVENFADIIISLVEVPAEGIKIKSKGVTVMPIHNLTSGKHVLGIFQKNRQGICPVYASLEFDGSTQTFWHLQWEGE